MRQAALKFAVVAGVPAALCACTPTVRVATPEPIRIDINLNITQEVRVQLEDDVEELIADNPDLF